MQERKKLFNSIKVEQSGRLQLSGWVSVQAAGTVTWRRRWYTFDEKILKFFKAQNVCSSAFALLLFTDRLSHRTHLLWMSSSSPIYATSGTAGALQKRNLGLFQTLSSSRKSTDAVGPFLLTHTTPWFVPISPLPAPIVIAKHSQDRIMAVLIFCSDVHKTSPSRRSSLTGRSTAILSVSRIPRLPQGVSS